MQKISTELPSATVDEGAASEPPTPASEAVQEPAAPEAEKEEAVHDKKMAAEKLILGASKFVASGDVDQALELLRRSIAYVRQKR